MNESFDLLTLFGESAFAWATSKFFDKSLSWLKNKEYLKKDVFNNIVDNIINNNSNIPLEKDYFVQLFVNPRVQAELKDFESAKKEIDLHVLVKEFKNIVFKEVEDIDNISNKIISDLLDEIKFEIFNDPIYTKRFFFSLLTIFRNSQTEYSQEILSKIRSIEDQIEQGFKELKASDTLTLQKLGEVNETITKGFENLPNSKNERLNSRIKIANDLMNEGKVISARKIYLEILNDVEKDEKDLLWKLNSNIGKSYLNDFNDTKAIEYFIEAYKIYPDEEKGLIQLAISNLVKEDYIDGIKITDRILSINPNSIDAKTLKSNFLIYNGKFADAISVLDNHELNNFDICYTLGFALGKAKRYAEANNILHKALEFKRSPIALDLIAINILEPLLNELHNLRPLNINRSGKFFEGLNKALKYLDESIELWNKQEIKKQLAIAYMNRGIIFSLLKEKDKCLEDYKNSKHLGLSGPILFRNLGICYVEKGVFSEATKYFSKAIEEGDEQSKEHLINSLILDRNFTEVKEIILKNVGGNLEDLSDNNFYFYSVLSEVYERELNYDESQKIIERLSIKYPDDIRVINRIVESKRSKGEIKEAINYLEEKIDQGQNKDILKLHLADLYFEIKNFEKSAQLYGDLHTEYQFGYIETMYLYSLNNFGKFNETLQLIDSIEKNIGTNIEELNKMRGNINLYFENFNEAKELFKKLATNYRKTDYYINWGLATFRLGEHDEAEKILNSAEKDFLNKPSELLKISSAYSMLGKTEKALDLAYNLVKQKPDDPHYNNNYILIFLNHTQINPSAKIEEEKKLLYQEIINTFEEKFPGEKNWTKIKVDNDFEEVKKILREQEQYFKQINQLYDFHRLPISITSKLINRNIYTTWAGYLNDSSRKIWAYHSDYSKVEFDSLKDYKGDIILEPVSFFTLYGLNKIDLLSKFKNFYVPQRLLDVIIFEINMLKMSLKTGLMNIFSLNGQLYKNEIPPFEVENNIKLLTEMTNILKGKTVGYEIDSDKYRDERMFKLLHEATSQAISYSLSNNILLMIDESSLLEFFIQKYNLKAFSSLTLLRLSKYHKKITTQEYNSIILKLVAGNYYFISLNADIIIHGLRSDNFNMSISSQYVVKYLNQPDINEESVATVLGDLFVYLYSEPITPIKQDTWLDFSLDCLPRNRLNTTVLLKIIYERVKFKYQGIIKYDEILRWLDSRLKTWALSRAVPYFR
jgi:tetratricopeptide (TPR) repeat protein